MANESPLPATMNRQFLATDQPFEIERLVSLYRVSRPLVVDIIKRYGPMRSEVERILLEMRPSFGA